MSDPQPPATSRRRRVGWQAVVLGGLAAVALATGGTALTLRLIGTAPAGGDDVALVATTPATLSAPVAVSDVQLTGGGAPVALAGSTPGAAIAPDITQLGTYAVASGHYTGVSATIGGIRRTAALDVQVAGGTLTPIVLVARPDSLSAAAGNDPVNQAVLTAAGQILRPPDVTFTDQHGNPVALHDLRGRVVVIAALDTDCHDTCPLYTALWSDLSSVIRERGWQDRVAVAEVSMDPGRDTPDELLAYARMTGATWPLLRADVASTFQFWLALHASYSKGPAPSPAPTDWYTGKPETYHLDHASVAVVIDQNGAARYILQGNPQLGHALSPALQALLAPGSFDALQQKASWKLDDLLDRVDLTLGVPLERERGGTEQRARAGARPPDFTLPGLDGGSVSLAAQRRPVVLTFWATWCGPCRHDFPEIAAAVRSHPDLAVLAVDEGESSGQVRDYLRSVLGADAPLFTTLLDSDRSIGARYAVAGMPTTVFVGGDGIVQRVVVGQLGSGDLADGLRAIGA